MRSVTHLGLTAALTLSVAAYAQTPSDTPPASQPTPVHAGSPHARLPTPAALGLPPQTSDQTTPDTATAHLPPTSRSRSPSPSQPHRPRNSKETKKQIKERQGQNKFRTKTRPTRSPPPAKPSTPTSSPAAKTTSTP